MRYRVLSRTRARVVRSVQIHFDVFIQNTTTYVPNNPARNGKQGEVSTLSSLDPSS